VDPVACNPASGWEKGQVENQVGLVRERFFTPRLRVKSYDELNAWLLDRCVAYAKAHPHSEQRPERVISPLPAAIIDRVCARCHVALRSGQRNGASQTKKLTLDF
jgi:hypothetical protein